MKEQQDRPGIPNGPQNDSSLNERAKPHTENELVNLFEESGVFDTHTPPGRDPTVFPMDVLAHLQSDVGMKADRLSRQNERLAGQLESWRRSINKVSMAYEITVYPFLDIAERNFAKDPLKDPAATSPHMEEMRINEGIRDAQEHPGQDLDEHPHRGPIELTPLEVSLLGRMTQVRGLPFSPQKRVFRYTEHLPRLQATTQAALDSHWISTENAIDQGMLRPRTEITEERRERQRPWTERQPGPDLPNSTPSKPRK